MFTFQTGESTLIQTKFYRSPLCVTLSHENKQCRECKKSESKEVNSAKRKLETLKSPAKLNAPQSGTNTVCLLTSKLPHQSWYKIEV